MGELWVRGHDLEGHRGGALDKRVNRRGGFGLGFSLHGRAQCLVGMMIREAVYRPKGCCIEIANGTSVSSSK